MTISSCATFTLVLLSLIEVVNGQSAVYHTLCRDQVVTVTPGSSGIIQHLQRVSSSPINCTLALRGFSSGSYVSLPGVDRRDPEDGCQQSPEISINNSPYCVRGDSSMNNIIIQLVNEELVVQLKLDNATSFTLEYYNNGECYVNMIYMNINLYIQSSLPHII